MHKARLAGKMRLEIRRTTNPVVVGDWVIIEPNEKDDTVVITEVVPRTNFIIRQSTRNRVAEHIIAANMDQALLLATIAHPRTSTGFIDRFLVTAAAYSVPVILVFNKTDTYNEKEQYLLAEFTDIYHAAGYTVHAISALQGTNLSVIHDTLAGKTTLISGHSGTGKSTLINALAPELELRTGAISRMHDKGTHTTTFAEMMPLPFGGYIIDTPGIKEFGLLDFEEAELSHFFPEMAKVLPNCKFNTCLHLDEPGCAVKVAVEAEEISPERYKNYLGMIHQLRTDEPIYD
jgi:ribosome biogenesis GTPase